MLPSLCGELLVSIGEVSWVLHDMWLATLQVARGRLTPDRRRHGRGQIQCRIAARRRRRLLNLYVRAPGCRSRRLASVNP